MALSEFLYRDWIVKQIPYGIDDVNYYIRSICYQVNKISKEELFFEKFNISSIQTIQATYDKIDLTQYGNLEKGKFKNQVLANIQYDDKIYKVKLSSTSLMICGAKINPIDLINHVAKKLSLKILNITTSMIICNGILKTLSPQYYINHPSAIIRNHCTILKLDQSSIFIYNSGKFIISSKSAQQNIRLYTDLYIQNDLKYALQLLFNLKSSWFNLLPLELCDVILSKLVTSI